MTLGAISFLSPLPLLGLLALPLIWWLLRATPPSPSRQQFPPTRILKKILQDETTSAHSPWWLTLLRLLAAALVILALSQPVLNNAAPLLSSAKVQANGPLVVMVDNGWSAANRWERRKVMMQRLLREAQAQQRLVYLVPTAPQEGAYTISPMSAVDAMTIVERMAPTAFSPLRVESFEKLLTALKGTNEAGTPTALNGAFFYLSDGLSQGEEVLVKARLDELKQRGMTSFIVSPSAEDMPFGLKAKLGQGGTLLAEILSPGVSLPQEGDVLALSQREDILGKARFTLAEGETSGEVKIELPLELRNQIARLQLDGHRSAGAIHLLDQRSNWRRVGLISNESGQLAQPLLSPLYYIRRALEPYAEIVTGNGEAIAETVETFTKRNVSVIVMADIGRLVGAPLLRLTEWVEKGGVLIRFAGPHMEESQDDLLPTPLRQGGRRLGGALSWAKPQALGPFDENSPFEGLQIPDDIFITRQLLADPSRLRDDVQIWARLKDGTPLVTATRELDGWVVLLHVTANSDWSNLPLSGLFVDMLRRLSQLSIAPVVPESGKSTSERGATAEGAILKDNNQAEAEDTPIASDQKNSLLAPYRTLNGYGRLEKPKAVVEPLAFSAINSVKIGPTHPPGFYGPPSQSVALNVLNKDDKLLPAKYENMGAELLTYRKAAERAFRAPLFLTALILLIIDSLIVMALRGVFSMKTGRPATSTATLFLGVLLITALIGFKPVAAQEPREQLPPSTAMKASLRTHLAYVITGNSQIDQTSRDGLRGLSNMLNNRTAVEPAEPMGVRIEKDELAFFPMLYWPVGPYTTALSDEGVKRVNSYMKQGGMIIFDTKDQDSRIGGLTGSSQQALERLLSRLDIPRLEPVPKDHVLTKSFYLLSSFPGRYQGGKLWVEARAKRARGDKETSNIDGVTTLMITSNDFASAWAVDQNFQTVYPVVPGGRLQREMAYRVGVNIVMYALAGNYKADQVHVPALLERLGQ